MSVPFFQVKDLKKHFPIKRGLTNKIVGYIKPLDGVTFTLEQGKNFGVVGETGSGKTILIFSLAMLYKPTGGQLLFEGNDITSMSKDTLRKFRKNIQVVFQDPLKSLSPTMKVGEILIEPLKIQNIGSEEERIQKAKDMLIRVGLETHFFDRNPKQLSGGQQQRVGIARALMLKPKLLLCDQPISALDVSIQAQVLNLFKEFFDITLFIVTNDLGVLRRICEKTAVMFLGKFIEIAPTEEICDNPIHPYTKMLVRLTPDMKEELKVKSQITVDKELPEITNLPAGCPYRFNCKKASSICEQKYPEMVEYLPNHFVACHNI